LAWVLRKRAEEARRREYELQLLPALPPFWNL
jgi:hypothetical protein